MIERGQALVFAGTRAACDELAREVFKATGVKAGVLHGDKLQHQRYYTHIHTYTQAHTHTHLLSHMIVGWRHCRVLSAVTSSC